MFYGHYSTVPPSFQGVQPGDNALAVIQHADRLFRLVQHGIAHDHLCGLSVAEAREADTVHLAADAGKVVNRLPLTVVLVEHLQSQRALAGLHRLALVEHQRFLIRLAVEVLQHERRAVLAAPGIFQLY